MQNNHHRKVSNYLKENIVFFCKDCEELVEVRPFGRKFVYRCAKCGTKNVAFGTEKSIKSFYRLNEDDDEVVKKDDKGQPELPEKESESKVKEPVGEKQA